MPYLLHCIHVLIKQLHHPPLMNTRIKFLSPIITWCCQCNDLSKQKKGCKIRRNFIAMSFFKVDWIFNFERKNKKIKPKPLHPWPEDILVWVNLVDHKGISQYWQWFFSFKGKKIAYFIHKLKKITTIKKLYAKNIWAFLFKKKGSFIIGSKCVFFLIFYYWVK